MSDGSLRNAAGTGAGGREFITRGGIKVSDAEEALEELAMFLKSARSKIRKSNRTSVHVHCNVQDLTLSQLVCLLTLYYSVEPILSRFNGFERENNLFCLQARFAEEIIANLRSFLETKRVIENCKYSALNYMPLQRGQLGTIEFRAGQGISKSPVEVLPWIQIIEQVYNTALKWESPMDILNELSAKGPCLFIEEALPSIYHIGLELFGSQMELDGVLMESVRVAQGLALRLTGNVSTQKKTKASW